MLAGAIEQCCPIVHQSAGGSQHLAGRADVNVALLIVGEGFPRERPVDSGRLVEDRMRFARSGSRSRWAMNTARAKVLLEGSENK
jgi:hypothetical protein